MSNAKVKARDDKRHGVGVVFGIGTLGGGVDHFLGVAVIGGDD